MSENIKLLVQKLGCALHLGASYTWVITVTSHYLQYVDTFPHVSICESYQCLLAVFCDIHSAKPRTCYSMFWSWVAWCWLLLPSPPTLGDERLTVLCRWYDPAGEAFAPVIKDQIWSGYIATAGRGWSSTDSFQWYRNVYFLWTFQWLKKKILFVVIW